MSSRDLRTGYARPFVGVAYDSLAHAVFAPVGGLDALREAALDVVDVRAGMHVLELGCGTGGLTRKLLARGARVVAVDFSAPMLKRAQSRAADAHFVQSDVTEYVPRRRFDRVLLAFVLHELEPAARRGVLERAREALEPGGRVAVLDHASPDAGVVPRMVSAVVRGFEPATNVTWLRDGFRAEIAAAGLGVERGLTLAHGTARVVVARRLS